jgi:hypothetical protein
VSPPEGQWQLESGGGPVTFGWGAEFNLASFEIGEADVEINDQRRPRSDMEAYGRDFFGGRTISFELNALDRDYAVLGRLARLQQAWNANPVRSRPGATAVLSWTRGGQSRRVYGRPRRFKPVTTLDYAGNVPVSCEFRTSDHLFYDELESSAAISVTASAQGGLVLPLRPPLVLSSAGSGRIPVRVGGTEPAWLVWVVDGPILNPEIEVVGQWSATLATSIAADSSVVVDPTPWARTVRRNDGANFSGAFTADSQRPSGMRLPPGDHEVILRGVDATGTAGLRLLWRSAWSSY